MCQGTPGGRSRLRVDWRDGMRLKWTSGGRAFLIATAVTSISLAAACGGGGTDSSGVQGPAGPAGPAGEPEGGYGMTQEQWDRIGEPLSSSDAAASRARATVIAQPTSVPRPTGTPPPPAAIPDFEQDSGEGRTSRELSSVLENQVAQAAQERIIVRTVDMSIEVMNVSDSIQEIGQIATLNGGWVVRTQHVESHRGVIDIRVPADRLDDTLASARQISENVKSEVSTSQDFTEEFTDTSARIATLQDTVTALRALFDRADEIEDALNIQREITNVQSDLEALQARLNFLSESSAFSLVSIEVLALPQALEVDAGEDMLAAAGGPVRFRAKFTPPEGIEDFWIEWDFGDGTSPQGTNRVAPFDTDGTVISAPVLHYFESETDSPYIVRVAVNGTGDSGASEGEDVTVVTVSRVPPIDVFAGNNQLVEAGDTVKLRGNFTRPDGVTDLVYTWDFGDGSTPLRVEAGAEDTIAEAEHTYSNPRPQSYEVVLKVSGVTEAGSTEGRGTMFVTVEEEEAIGGGSFTPGETGKDAFGILATIGKGIGNAAVFIAVLSPIWIILAAVAFAAYRMNRRRSARNANKSGIRMSQATPPESPAS